MAVGLFDVAQVAGNAFARSEASDQREAMKRQQFEAANLLNQSFMQAGSNPDAARQLYIQAYQLAPDFVSNAVTGLQSQQKAMGGGEGDDGKRFDQSKKLRDEYRAISKDFEQVSDAYGRIQASVESPDAAGDIALIFNYMKMLDPGSVVREGEFATAQNAGGVDSSVRNWYNKLINGERLQPEQRSMFSSRAEKLFSTAAKKNAERKQGIVRVGKEYGIKESDIFGLPEQEPDAAADNSEKVVFTSDQYGDVTEADIQETMKANGISRDEVLRRLGVK